MLAAVRDGVVQGAVTGTPYYSGEWPLGSFHAIPGVLKANDEFPAVATEVAWDYWDKSLKAKYLTEFIKNPRTLTKHQLFSSTVAPVCLSTVWKMTSKLFLPSVR